MRISVEVDSANRRDDGLALIKVSGPKMSTVELDLPFRNLHRSFGSPDPTALDLLVVAGACYVVDKVTPRKSTSDAWTRDLNVSFPVSDPKRWGRVARRLEAALTFLSGDVWRVSFRPLPCELFIAPKTRRKRTLIPGEPETFEAVTLFSGGLDSLVGTIDFLQENPSSRVMLIGHYDSPGPRSQQRALYEPLRANFPGRTKLVQVRVSQRPQKNNESTLRSRSIVFLGLGMYAASEVGSGVSLLTPENGTIALNLPLTPSRSGSCSTRTMHPFYLDALRSVLNELGLKNELVNPLAMKTKGECITQCQNRELLSSLVARTVSCSHASRRQNWERKSATNCGYCVPCLFRRAALHAAKLDSGKRYGIDVCADELTANSDEASADDLRAVTNGLRHFGTDTSIRRAIISVARVEPLDGYVSLVHRGLSELRNWIADKGSASLRAAAGLGNNGHA